MKQYAFVVELDRCIGCKGCQVACKCWNGLPSTLEKNGNPSTGSYQSPMDLNGDTRLLISFHEEAGGDKGVKWAPLVPALHRRPLRHHLSWRGAEEG